MSSALAKEIGEELELTIASSDDELELVGDGEADWYDARLPDGTPVEIKACAFRVGDTSESRRGRFYIKRRAHERLLEAGGRYRLGVYDDDRDLVVEIDVPAEVVDEAITAWIETPASYSYEYAQVRWNAVIDPDEVAEA